MDQPGGGAQLPLAEDPAVVRGGGGGGGAGVGGGDGGQWGFALHEDDDLGDDDHDAPAQRGGPPGTHAAQNGMGDGGEEDDFDENPRSHRAPQGGEAPREFAGNRPDAQSEGSDQSSIAGDSETTRRRPKIRAQSVAGDGPGRNEQLQQQPRRPPSIAGNPRRDRGGYQGFGQMGMGRDRGGGFDDWDDPRGFGDMNNGFMGGRGRMRLGQERNPMGFPPGIGRGMGRGW